VTTEPGETDRVTHDAEARLWVEQLRSGHPRHEKAVPQRFAAAAAGAGDPGPLLALEAHRRHEGDRPGT
jgi:hypothetical protein